MKSKENRINELIEKYKENRCSSSELDELVDLVTDDETVLQMDMLDTWNRKFSLVKKKNMQKFTHVYKYFALAASMAILVGLFYFLSKGESAQPLEYITGNGEVREIELVDGSTVLLNANSRLILNEDFKNSLIRKVELVGEAYFKVAKSFTKDQRQRRFELRTSDMLIDVLGTSFNVSARSNSIQEVYLEEGSIDLNLVKGEKQRLVPGEKVEYNSEKVELLKIEDESIETAASWVNGILSYKDQTLQEVMGNLEILFGESFTFDENVDLLKKINLGVPYMDWEHTKKALEMALELKIEEHKNGYRVTSIH